MSELLRRQYEETLRENSSYRTRLSTVKNALADKDAEIARLKIALGQIANKRCWSELSPSALQDAYSDMRRIARAALNGNGAQARKS